MLFRVWYEFKDKGGYGLRLVTVFNVSPNKNGYPHFLIYYEGQWKYVSAKHCTPEKEYE